MKLPKNTACHVASIVAGFALDLVLGDPPHWPHPVKVIGKQIAFEEKLLRKWAQAALANKSWPHDLKRTELLAGMALTASVAAVAPLVGAGGLALLNKVHPVLSFAAETVLCYQLLAARSLAQAAQNVYGKLSAGDVEGARFEVAMIVGRDTDSLDAEGIARATVETVAENTSDGVVAPLLYMGLGGAPAALFYKAVNTLDSMVGYKNDAYLNFGFASAKLDDMINYIPARITGVLMCASAGLARLDARGAWRIFWRDRLNHSSPNSAHAEAACAGALGVQLGGANSYFGQVVEKPTIGVASRPIEAEDIVRSVQLMGLTAVLGLIMAALSALGNKTR